MSTDYQLLHPIERMYTETSFPAKWRVDFAYKSLMRTIKSDDWLLKKSKALKLSPQKMYEVVRVGARKWKINATSEYLAATLISSCDFNSATNKQ